MNLLSVEADDLLKLELLRIADALGLDRTERLLAGIRRSQAREGAPLPMVSPPDPHINWAGQTQATKVVREWINTHHVEYLEQSEAWYQTGEILRAYLLGMR